jgi:hypothetical protein
VSVRLRPGVLIDDALANALAKLALRSRTRQVSIANAAPAETAIPAGSRGPDANVRYVRPAIYVWLSPDISVLVYRGQYAALRISPGRCYWPVTWGEVPELLSVMGGRVRFVRSSWLRACRRGLGARSSYDLGSSHGHQDHHEAAGIVFEDTASARFGMEAGWRACGSPTCRPGRATCWR